MESASEVHEIVIEDEESPFDFVTILRSEDVAPGKRIVIADGAPRLADQVEKEAAARENRKPAKPPHPSFHTVSTLPLRADHLLDDLFAAVSTAKHSYAIHGALRDGSRTRNVRRRKALFDDARHAWIALDVDKLACDFPDGDSVAAFARDRLPEEFRDRRCAWNLTPSHMLKSGKSRVRLYFALDRAVTLAETKSWLLRATIADGLAIDRALWNSRVQENFLRPSLDRGVADPYPNRWGILPGDLELVAVPEIDTSAIAAKSERRGLAALGGAVVDDPAYIAYALPRLFAERTVDRIDSDGRQNTFRYLAQDFQDRAFSQDVCEAACLHFYFHGEETADALRETLDEKGVARAGKFVDEVTALGESRDDVWLGREGTIDESDILSQVHQGYAGAQNAFGCKTLADEDASADFAAVDDEDDDSPRSAFDAWSADPLDSNLSGALVTALAAAGADKLKARACVALAEMPAFAGASDESLEWIKETVVKTEPATKTSAGLFTIAADIAREFKPREWLVRDMIPRQGIGLMAAAMQSYKSFLALRLLACAGEAKPFFGAKIVEPTCGLYICGEGREGVEQRLAALALVQPDTLRTFAVLNSRPNLHADPRASATIVAAAKALEKATGLRCGLVVLDTVAALMTGLDGNSEKEVGVVTAHMRKIADKTGAFVLGVAHLGKDPTRGVRGSSAWGANVDAILDVERGEMPLTGSLRASKNKDGALADEWLPFKLNRHVVGRHADGEAITSLMVEEVDPAIVATVENEMERANRALRERIKAHCQDKAPGAWVALTSLAAALGEEGFGEKSNRAAYFRRVIMGGKTTAAVGDGYLTVRSKGRGAGVEVTASRDGFCAAEEETEEAD